MTPPTSRRRPPGRYDEPSLLGQRVLAVMLAVLVVALAVAAAVALFQRFGGDAVRGRTLGYDVTSDREVTVEVEVSKPQGGRAYCLIRARRADGAEVGRAVAEVDPVGTPGRTARGRFPIATTAQAVTGEVTACRVEPLTREDIAP